MSELIAACSECDIVRIDQLLERTDVNAVDDDGFTALHFAAMLRPSMVSHLLARKADPNKENRRGWTALHYAVETRSVYVVDLLLPGMQGASCFAFHLACRSGLLYIAERILHELQSRSCEITLDSPDEHGTPALLWACMRNEIGIVELLLRHGANANVLAIDASKSPLIWACLRKHYRVCELLVANGARVNYVDQFQNSALHYAATWSLPLVQLLLKHGAASVPNHRERTPHMQAALAGNVEIARYFLALGDDIYQVDSAGDNVMVLTSGLPNAAAFCAMYSESSLLYDMADEANAYHTAGRPKYVGLMTALKQRILCGALPNQIKVMMKPKLAANAIKIITMDKVLTVRCISLGISRQR